MEKIRLTKGELKKQSEKLSSFQRYLPTLNVKKKLLQKELNRSVQDQLDLKKEMDRHLLKARPWLGVLAPDPSCLDWLKIVAVQIEADYLAGLELPRFESMQLELKDYDLYSTPLWMDEAFVFLKEHLILQAKSQNLLKRIQLLNQELQITNQRINLFEKVKIPEAKENIKTIRTYLDDQQTIAVGWALGAKKKLQRQEALHLEGS